MTRPINCRGARAVRRIVRFAFRMQGRIVVHMQNLCAKHVQCSCRNIRCTFPSALARRREAMNVPVGTLKHFVSWDRLLGDATRGSVLIGTLCVRSLLVFRSEQVIAMFRSEHIVTLFLSEHIVTMFRSERSCLMFRWEHFDRSRGDSSRERALPLFLPTCTSLQRDSSPLFGMNWRMHSTCLLSGFQEAY
jgi:hypothetical protein